MENSMNNLINDISEYPKFYTKTGKIDVPTLKRIGFYNTTLYFSIVKSTSFLKDTAPLGNRIFCLTNNITNNPLCNCGNELKFVSNVKGYRKSCSMNCKCKPKKSKEVIARIKQTKLERYGNENYNNQKQHKETCLKKYGNETYTNSEQQKETKSLYTKEKKESININRKKTKLEKYGNENYCNTVKIKLTKLERYNDENYCNTVKIKRTKLERYGDCVYVNPEKAKETNLERYGEISYSKTKEFSLVIKQTKLERYGNENYNNSEKAKETNLERYGVEYYSQTYEFRNKCKLTNLERYGVNHHTHRIYNNGVYEKLNNKEWLIEQHHELKLPLSQMAKMLTVDNTTMSNYFKKYNIEIKHFIVSYAEKSLAEYIVNTYNTTVVSNIRSIITPKEIDIYLPEYKLAIEYNGIYWHSPNRYKTKEHWFNYHQDKIDMCNEKGIQLLHLWENYGNHNALLDNALNNCIIDNNLNKIYKEVKWP